VICGCSFPDSLAATGCNNLQILYNIYYGILITFAGIFLVPLIKQGSAQLKAVGKVYTDNILTGDKSRIETQGVQDELAVAFFSIAVGWAWSVVSDTECDEGFSPTCPATMDFKGVMLFLLMILIYQSICLGMFHIFMETCRLADRTTRLLDIEQGKASRLFEGADTDNSGTIDEQELKSFLESNGIDTVLFLQAFHALDRRDGVKDGHCKLDELIEEFRVICNQIKQGEKPYPTEALPPRPAAQEKAVSLEVSPKSSADNSTGAQAVHEV